MCCVVNKIILYKKGSSIFIIVRMETKTLLPGMKQVMPAHVQAQRPKAGYHDCQFCHALADYQSQALALGACGQDIICLKTAISEVSTSVNELKYAMAKAQCKFEADPFPSREPEEEQLQ